jgi:hypothetical protein
VSDIQIQSLWSTQSLSVFLCLSEPGPNSYYDYDDVSFWFCYSGGDREEPLTQWVRGVYILLKRDKQSQDVEIPPKQLSSVLCFGQIYRTASRVKNQISSSAASSSQVANEIITGAAGITNVQTTVLK